MIASASIAILRRTPQRRLRVGFSDVPIVRGLSERPGSPGAGACAKLCPMPRVDTRELAAIFLGAVGDADPAAADARARGRVQARRHAPVRAERAAARRLWGYHGNHRPHGEHPWSLRRRVPVLTTTLDTP